MKNSIQKIIKVFLAILFLTTSFLMQVEAQEYDWQKSNSLSEGKSVVAVSEDGSKIATAGFDSYIVISSDGGQTWVTATSSGSSFWADISISSDGTKLVATNNNKIYTSTNGGITWLERAPKTGYEYWKQVYYVPDGSKIIAVHYDNEFLYTSVDDGETWQTVNFLGSKNWNYVSSSQDGSRIVVIGYNDYIYTSSDFGATWNKQEGLGVKGWKFVNTSSDSFKILAVAEEGYFYVSTNFGETWQEMGPYNTSGDFQLRYSKDGSRLFGFQGGLKVSLDDGLTWFLQPGTATSYGVYWKTVIPYQNTSKALALKNDGYLYFGEAAPMRVSKENDYVIGKGKVLFSGEANSPYKKKGVEYCLTTSSLEECVYDQTFVEEGDFSFGSFSLTVSDLLPKEYYRYRLFVEDSEGNKAYSENLFTYVDYKVWAAKTNAGKRNWKAITSSSDGNQLAAIENYGENIYISKDKGNTWELKSFPFQHWADINSSPDGKYVIASGKNYIYLSSDFGATWSSLNNPPEVDYWYKISLSDDGKTIGTIAHNRNDYYERVYVSTDSGESWASSTDPINPKDIYVSPNGEKILSVGWSDAFFISNNYGATWISKPITTYANGYWEDLSVSDDENNIIITATNGAFVSYSTDGGDTWYKAESPSYAASGLATSRDGNKSMTINAYQIGLSIDGGKSWKEVLKPDEEWSATTISVDGEGKNFFVGFQNGYIYSYGELGIPKIDLGSNIVNSSSSVSFSAFVNTDHTRRGVEYCSSATLESSCTYEILEEADSFNVGTFTATATNLTPNSYYRYRFFAENEKGIAYSEDNIFLLKYNDWVEINSGQISLDSLAISKKGDKVVALSGGSVYISNNYGQDWNLSSAPLGDWVDLKMSENGEVIFLGNKIYGRTENSIFSLDGGDTWNDFPPNFDIFFDAFDISPDGKYLYFIDYLYFFKLEIQSLLDENFILEDIEYEEYEELARNGDWYKELFVGNGGSRFIAFTDSVYISTDEGKTWVDTNPPLLSLVTGIDASKDGKTIVITRPLPIEGVNPGYSFISRNGGATWEEITSLGSNYWNGVAISDDGYKILISDWDGNVYSSLDGGETWNKETDVPNGYSPFVSMSGSGANMFVGWEYSDNTETPKIYRLYNELPQAKGVVAKIKK